MTWGNRDSVRKGTGASEERSEQQAWGHGRERTA